MPRLRSFARLQDDGHEGLVVRLAQHCDRQLDRILASPPQCFVAQLRSLAVCRLAKSLVVVGQVRLDNDLLNLARVHQTHLDGEVLEAHQGGMPLAELDLGLLGAEEESGQVSVEMCCQWNALPMKCNCNPQSLNRVTGCDRG